MVNIILNKSNLKKNLTSILEYVPEERREMVRSVIIDQDLNQGQKIRCLLKEGREFAEKLLKFLKKYVSYPAFQEHSCHGMWSYLSSRIF